VRQSILGHRAALGHHWQGVPASLAALTDRLHLAFRATWLHANGRPMHVAAHEGVQRGQELVEIAGLDEIVVRAGGHAFIDFVSGGPRPRA